MKEKECLSTQWDNTNRVFISSTFLQPKSAHKARESKRLLRDIEREHCSSLRYSILQTFSRHRKEFNSTIIYLFRFRNEQINILQLCRLSRFYLKFSSCRQVVRFLQRGDSWNLRDFKQRRKLAFLSFCMPWRHQICLATFLILIPAFLDTGLPRGNVHERDSGPMQGANPYPIPQPVKVGHTTGVYDSYSFRIVLWVLLRLTRTNQWKCCKTGPTVFSSLSEMTRKSNRLRMSLQIKAALSSQLFKDPECWPGQGLNPRPSARQTGALPTGPTLAEPICPEICSKSRLCEECKKFTSGWCQCVAQKPVAA